MKWYVYSLSYQGIVFYIGSTKQPYKRYKEHYSLTHSNTTGIIYLIREKKEYIDFEILFISEDKDQAIRAEYTIIREFAAKKHALCNKDGNTYDNILYYYYHWFWGYELPRLNYPSFILQDIQNKIDNYDFSTDRHKYLDNAASIGLRAWSYGSMHT